MKGSNFIIIVLLGLLIGGFAFAQIPGGFWYPDDNNYLQPVEESWGVYLPSGNIGIGTASPGSKLTVYTTEWDTVNTPLVNITNLDANATDADGLLVRGGANNSSSDIFKVQDYSGNTDFVVVGHGKVGIGTASPDYKLEVDGTFDATTLSINDGTLTFPTIDGSANQVMKTDGSGNITWATDTTLTEEAVEDFVGGMLGGTETHISVTYQDGTNDIDFVVADDWWDNLTDMVLTDTYIYVGDASNDPVGVDMTGDCTISNLGVIECTQADALEANPTDCGANQFAQSIVASGNLTCAAIADADVPDNITIDSAGDVSCAECLIIGTEVKAGTLTDTKYCIWDAGSSQIVCDSVPGGAGDVEAVGDCASGLCLDGTSDGGTNVTFYNIDSNKTQLIASDVASDLVVTLPATSMTIKNWEINSGTIHTDNYIENPFGGSIGDAEVDNNITIDLATLATTLTVTDNEATNEANAILFTADAELVGGNLAIESDGTLNYNPSTGTLTTTVFVGNLTGAVTGNASTATALAGDPADCAANQFADSINASGTLGCNAIADADVTALTTLSNLVSMGTIGTGIWQATDIGVAYGGTGTSSLTDHGVLVGSGANALTALTVGTNGQILVGSTGADPVFATLTCGDDISCTIGAGTLEIDVDDSWWNALTDMVLTDNYIYVGDASNDPVGVAMSNDCSIASNGNITCDHDALDNFLATEHVNWAAAAAGTIHTDNYVEGHGDGGNCGAGEYALGVDASGAVQNCTDATTEINTVVNALGGTGLTCAAQSCNVDLGTSIATGEIDADTITHANIADSDQTITGCYRYEKSTGILATDDKQSIWANKTANNFLITEIFGESDQNVAFDLQVDDGSPADVSQTDINPNAGEAEDTSLDGDTTLAAGEELDLLITSVGSTPTWLSVCWTGNWVD